MCGYRRRLLLSKCRWSWSSGLGFGIDWIFTGGSTLLMVRFRVSQTKPFTASYGLTAAYSLHALYSHLHRTFSSDTPDRVIPAHCMGACSSHLYCTQYATHLGKSHSFVCPVRHRDDHNIGAVLSHNEDTINTQKQNSEQNHLISSTLLFKRLLIETNYSPVTPC